MIAYNMQSRKNRYFLELAFNGAKYSGWQIQRNSPTIQETLQDSIGTILQEETKLIGCGRTDARVHAKEFYAHFDTDHTLDNNFAEKANRILPRDIWVKNLLRPTSPKAHARFDAYHRTYEYWLCTNRNPFYLDLATYYFHHVDLDRMNQASGYLKKYEDYETFSKINPNLKHYKCQVYDAWWEEVDDHLFKFTISANRFVRSMVRLIVATLIRVGNGRMNIAEFEDILAARDRSLSADAAPPDGLYLSQVLYPNGLLQMV